MNRFSFLKKYTAPTLLVLFLIGILVIISSFLINFGLGESGYNFLGKTKKVTLSPGIPITQTFTARKENLHQIRVVLGNADLHWGERLEFRLMDETCTTELSTATFHHRPSEQGAYTSFSFPSLADSADKRYCFVATYFSDENRKGDKPYLSATEEPDPVFSDRILTDSNKNKVYPGQTLFLRPVYTTGSHISDLSQLIERLSFYKPGFLKDQVLVILFAIFLGGTIILPFFFIFSPPKISPRDDSHR